MSYVIDNLLGVTLLHFLYYYPIWYYCIHDRDDIDIKRMTTKRHDRPPLSSKRCCFVRCMWMHSQINIQKPVDHLFGIVSTESCCIVYAGSIRHTSMKDSVLHSLVLILYELWHLSPPATFSLRDFSFMSILVGVITY